MARQKSPTAEDRLLAIRIALSGMATDRDLGEVCSDLDPLHPKHNTFPGEVFLELGADALEEAGASRAEPIDFDELLEKYPADIARPSKAQRLKSRFVLRGAAMMQAGVDPGLLDEVYWWQTDDLWVWALDALVAYVRIAAERTGLPVAEVCARLAERHGVELAP